MTDRHIYIHLPTADASGKKTNDASFPADFSNSHLWRVAYSLFINYSRKDRDAAERELRKRGIKTAADLEKKGGKILMPGQKSLAKDVKSKDADPKEMAKKADAAVAKARALGEKYPKIKELTVKAAYAYARNNFEEGDKFMSKAQSKTKDVKPCTCAGAH